MIRIIAGEHRGRKLHFPNIEDLRPTSDRARETLFNWLQTDTRGTRCLDLFAGSGALGFEALSRGAKHCDFVEKNRHVASNIKENVALLNAKANVYHQSYSHFLNSTSTPYDLIFIDPPFKQNLWVDVILQLNTQRLVHSNSLMYIEHDGTLNDDALPTLSIVKQKQIGASTLLLLTPN